MRTGLSFPKSPECQTNMIMARKLLLCCAVAATFVYANNGDCDLLGAYICAESVSPYDCTRLYGCANSNGCSAGNLELPPMSVCKQIEGCSQSSIRAVASCYLTSTDRCSDLRACYGRGGCSAYSDWVLERYCPKGAITYCSSDKALRVGECIGGALIVDSACSAYQECLAQGNCDVIREGLDPLLPRECRSKANVKSASITTIGTVLIIILLVGV